MAAMLSSEIIQTTRDDYLWIYKINKNTEKKELSCVSDRNDLRIDWKSKILRVSKRPKRSVVVEAATRTRP